MYLSFHHIPNLSSHFSLSSPFMHKNHSPNIVNPLFFLVHHFHFLQEPEELPILQSQRKCNYSSPPLWEALFSWLQCGSQLHNLSTLGTRRPSTPSPHTRPKPAPKSAASTSPTSSSAASTTPAAPPLTAAAAVQSLPPGSSPPSPEQPSKYPPPRRLPPATSP